jgi:acetyltransferase-like isoleucine patch superfamily enzyme
VPDLEAQLRDAVGDPAVEALLGQIVAPTVEELIRRALADHRDRDAHIEARGLLGTMLVFGDDSRLHIHPTAKVNNAVINLSSGTVTVGAYSFFGHNVSVLTGTHDVETFGAERQDAIPASGHDVVIGAGVWVASNAIVVGPCTIGDHAVVAVGSLVLDDIDPYTIVAGSPAKVVRVIDHDAGR